MKERHEKRDVTQCHGARGGEPASPMLEAEWRWAGRIVSPAVHRKRQEGCEPRQGRAALEMKISSRARLMTWNLTARPIVHSLRSYRAFHKRLDSKYRHFVRLTILPSVLGHPRKKPRVCIIRSGCAHHRRFLLRDDNGWIHHQDHAFGPYCFETDSPERGRENEGMLAYVQLVAGAQQPAHLRAMICVVLHSTSNVIFNNPRQNDGYHILTTEDLPSHAIST